MVWPFLTIYLRRTLNVPLATVASLLTISSIMAMLSSFIGGSIADRLGRKVPRLPPFVKMGDLAVENRGNETDRLDGIDDDLTFVVQRITSTDLDVWAHPHSDAACDLTAPNSFAKTFHENHERSFEPNEVAAHWHFSFPLLVFLILVAYFKRIDQIGDAFFQAE